jgi:hypothetical protein
MGGGLHFSGGDYRVRCPVHGGVDLNLSIRNGTKGADILVRCYSHECDRRAILKAIDEIGGRERRRPESIPLRDTYKSDPSKLRHLLGLLQPLEGTIGATYLRTRDLYLPSLGHHMRFLPAKPPRHPWPCMVGIVTDFTDATRILTLHFTRLHLDGLGKAPLPKHEQRSYLAGFPKKGGVIRLTDDADVDTRLGIAEGVETALAVHTSFRRAGWHMPVWSALDAGNMGALRPLDGIERLAIYADRGRAGELAADTLAQRWRSTTSAEVLISTARRDDWNPEAEAS